MDALAGMQSYGLLVRQAGISTWLVATGIESGVPGFVTGACATLAVRRDVIAGEVDMCTPLGCGLGYLLLDGIGNILVLRALLVWLYCGRGGICPTCDSPI